MTVKAFDKDIAMRAYLEEQFSLIPGSSKNTKAGQRNEILNNGIQWYQWS